MYSINTLNSSSQPQAFIVLPYLPHSYPCQIPPPCYISHMHNHLLIHQRVVAVTVPHSVPHPIPHPTPEIIYPSTFATKSFYAPPSTFSSQIPPSNPPSTSPSNPPSTPPSTSPSTSPSSTHSNSSSCLRSPSSVLTSSCSIGELPYQTQSPSSSVSSSLSSPPSRHSTPSPSSVPSSPPSPCSQPSSPQFNPMFCDSNSNWKDDAVALETLRFFPNFNILKYQSQTFFKDPSPHKEAISFSLRIVLTGSSKLINDFVNKFSNRKFGYASIGCQMEWNPSNESSKGLIYLFGTGNSMRFQRVVSWKTHSFKTIGEVATDTNCCLRVIMSQVAARYLERSQPLQLECTLLGPFDSPFKFYCHLPESEGSCLKKHYQQQQ